MNIKNAAVTHGLFAMRATITKHFFNNAFLSRPLGGKQIFLVGLKLFFWFFIWYEETGYRITQVACEKDQCDLNIMLQTRQTLTLRLARHQNKGLSRLATFVLNRPRRRFLPSLTL